MAGLPHPFGDGARHERRNSRPYSRRSHRYAALPGNSQLVLPTSIKPRVVFVGSAFTKSGVSTRHASVGPKVTLYWVERCRARRQHVLFISVPEHYCSQKCPRQDCRVGEQRST
jgi:hypothetical protein